MLFPTIKGECSEFINNCGGFPMYKNLPSSREGFIRVKARHRKIPDHAFSDAFNTAFKNQTNNLLSKSIFCNSKEALPSDHEKYYIFPINGYRILYSQNEKNSSATYQKALMEILDIVAEKQAISLLTTILSDDYTDDKLENALSQDREIIIYNIPYFFAIKCSLFPNISDYKNIIYN